ncbi:class I glutamine amidotransferase-like protein [Podospora australis]|uniref:Class I glutamine amidotransferase-like protein n=1 Tax=Podospora australis TaxID=1536484 RepID=A0AAN7AD67_9PEZI|nr:class I glutamine amidotransferase-like protein [Podospora australis]
MSPKTLRIGVMLEQVQLSDIMGIDIFGNISQSYLDDVIALNPDKFSGLKDHALDVQFYYISSDLEPTTTTPPQSKNFPGSGGKSSGTSFGGFKFIPNTTYDTCPRDLDILLIGGPLPTHRPVAADKFLKEAWGKTRVVMTTCIGSMWLASTGLLKGKKCTTNKEFLGAARGIHPEIEWVWQRWVVDEKNFEGKGKGELWTAGGAGCGIDMIAKYCLDNYDAEFVNLMALEGLEMNPGGRASQFYASEEPVSM